MQDTTLAIITILIILATGIIGKLIRKEGLFERTNSDAQYRIMAAIYMIPFLLFFPTSRYDYYSPNAARDRIKHHIPCIDSTMELITRRKNLEEWKNTKSNKGNGVEHIKKIKIGMNGIVKETDRFSNANLNKTLVLETTLPGIFRKHRSNFRLLPVSQVSKDDEKDAITINTKQADSVLHSWNSSFVYNCFPIRR